MTKKRSRSRNVKKKRRITGRGIFITFFSLAAFTAFCFIIGYLLVFLGGQKFLNENKDKMIMSEATTLYDIHGEPITKLYIQHGNRDLITLDEVPDLLVEALIATEDRRFREHAGIDYWSIGRAIVKDVVQRRLAEGGSTITQQLAKNMFLSSDKTFFRKANEAAIALAIERNYDKDDILEMYLNRIYFGNGAYGVKSAAEIHFGVTDLHDLTVSQIATLVGIPKAPSHYSPTSNPERSKERRAVVLRIMKDQQLITEEEERAANEEEFPEVPSKEGEKYQSFIDYAVREAVDQSGISEDELLQRGFHIYTTLNMQAQNAVDRAFEQSDLFPTGSSEAEQVEGAMVIIDQKTGAIVAMNGGRGYVVKGTNRVTIPRQPGSAFKPIITYAPALETKKWSNSSMLVDKKMPFGDYNPSNYNHQYLGEATMAESIKRSLNIPAVWLLNEIHISTGLEFVQKLGIELPPEDRNLAIALGGLTHGVTPLQMAQAYSGFANEGLMNEAYTIQKIEDRSNRVVFAHKQTSKQVMSKQTAQQMTQMLQGVVEPGGTGTQAKMNRPVAGKTGSTQFDGPNSSGGNRDLWFVGYTPEYTAAVWMGYDDQRLYMTQGSSAPARMFASVMTEALAGWPVVGFSGPSAPIEEEEEEPEDEPLGVVSDLSAQYDYSKKQVTLRWSAAGEEVGYNMYRKSSDESDFTLMLEQIQFLEMADFMIEPGVTYEYYVTVVDSESGEEGEPSNIAKVQINEPIEEEEDPVTDEETPEGQGPDQEEPRGEPSPPMDDEGSSEEEDETSDQGEPSIPDIELPPVEDLPEDETQETEDAI